MDADDLRQQAANHGQGHLFAFWEELDQTARQALLADVGELDFELLDSLIARHVRAAGPAASASKPRPPRCLPAEPATPDQARLYADARQRGQDLIANGKVAALVVAGGQGTRLGFDGPKGAFAISPVQNKTLFQLFAESLLATQQLLGKPVHWYIMTSPINDQPTREFLARHGFFGVDAGDVFFFQQGVMPAVDPVGRILLADKHRLALAPDGHGGSLRALAASGALADMAEHGAEIISYFQVDNPLVTPVDPLLVGLHDLTGSQMSSLTIPKASDDERVGLFAMVDGALRVIEYTNLPEDLARARKADGSRTFDAANIAIHVLSRAFVEEITRPGSSLALPWHQAQKAVPHVDPVTGQPVTPDGPNAVKFEMFVFDALPLATDPLLLEARRSEVFSPIKNATGVDSPATARRDLIRRAAAWLEQCGVNVPRTADGQPDCTVEISPLLVDDGPKPLGEWGDWLRRRPAIEAGATVYVHAYRCGGPPAPPYSRDEFVKHLAPQLPADDQVFKCNGSLAWRENLELVTLDFFRSLCHWKSPRSQPKVLQNTVQDVQAALHDAVNCVADGYSKEAVKGAVERLRCLHGVEIPTASALLTAWNPQDFGIVDQKVFSVLEFKGKPDSAHKYYRFRQCLIMLRSDLGLEKCSLRQLELALWYYYPIQLCKVVPLWSC